MRLRALGLMPVLRASRALGRKVLGAWALVLALNLLVPLLQPGSFQWLCSGHAGLKLKLDRSLSLAGAAADGQLEPERPCPLCGAAPLPLAVSALRVPAESAAPVPVLAAQNLALALVPGAPLPARGPPLRLLPLLLAA
jgi:hypothetical protein